MTTCEHEWVVFSTAMAKPTIMVQCAICREYGGVQDFTHEEWALAYYAPSWPFRWADSSRVILRADLPKVTPEDVQRWEDFIASKRDAAGGA